MSSCAKLGLGTAGTFRYYLYKYVSLTSAGEDSVSLSLKQVFNEFLSYYFL